MKQNENRKEFCYKIINETKISFIATVYNQENYLSTFIYSIQNQKLEEYELIFIDDFSEDNSTRIIEKFKKKDKRIKLIKNKKNMGTLYSRYIGQINSKSDYIIFIDSDDIILKTGIFNSYNHIKNYNLDIVQFHSVWEDINRTYIHHKTYIYKKIIYNPILSYIFYYNINQFCKGNEINYALWDKLIKKKVVSKAFQWIGDIYLKKKIIIHNDLIILFAILQMSYSYQYIDEIGYYYISSKKNSAINSWKDLSKVNQIIHSIFTNIEFLYEKTNNTLLDKYFCVFKINHYFKIYYRLFKYINDKEYEYIKKIINKLIDSNYISIKDKLKISNMEIIIKNMKNIFLNNNTNTIN